MDTFIYFFHNDLSRDIDSIDREYDLTKQG